MKASSTSWQDCSIPRGHTTYAHASVRGKQLSCKSGRKVLQLPLFLGEFTFNIKTTIVLCCDSKFDCWQVHFHDHKEVERIGTCRKSILWIRNVVFIYLEIPRMITQKYLGLWACLLFSDMVAHPTPVLCMFCFDPFTHPIFRLPAPWNQILLPLLRRYFWLGERWHSQDSCAQRRSPRLAMLSLGCWTGFKIRWLGNLLFLKIFYTAHLAQASPPLQRWFSLWSFTCHGPPWFWIGGIVPAEERGSKGPWPTDSLRV